MKRVCAFFVWGFVAAFAFMRTIDEPIAISLWAALLSACFAIPLSGAWSASDDPYR